MIRFVHLLAILSLAGCAELVAIPGTERDARWDACDGGPVGWHCWGSGPIRRVCMETIAGPFGWHRRACHWERFAPEHPERGGATVPYAEPGS